MKRITNNMELVMHLGKKGITQEFLEEVNKNLKANYQVRIKLLPSSLGTQDRFSMKDQFKELFPKKKVTLIGKTLTISK